MALVLRKLWQCPTKAPAVSEKDSAGCYMIITWCLNVCYCKKSMAQNKLSTTKMVRLMEEILHQLIWRIHHYFQGFIHPRWCRISSINSIASLFFWEGRSHFSSEISSVGFLRSFLGSELAMLESLDTKNSLVRNPKAKHLEFHKMP